MRSIERDLDRILNRLRHAIRERGYTQLEVQDVLGWGRSYISQLLTRQKSLRFEQILLILNVIGVPPGDFFSAIYPLEEAASARRAAAAQADDASMRAELRRIERLYEGIVGVLKKKGLISTEELAGAIERARHRP